MEQNRGIILSGQEIADQFRVSRNAVWKAVGSLRKQGYVIDAVKGTGYLLSELSDRISAAGIRSRMKIPAVDIQYYETIHSTNSAAKEAAMTGAVHGSVIVADEQTAGRGRSGNSFQSPKSLGLYMSVILRTDRIHLDEPILCTLYAAAAVVLAIEQITAQSCAIKWVNDILIDQKKVCGILSEGILDFESGHADWLVIGFGINVKARAFPEELPYAGTVQREGDESPLRCALAGAILDRLLSLKFWSDRDAMLDVCRNRITCLQKQVHFNDHGKDCCGIAVDLARDGKLQVLMADGQMRSVTNSLRE